MAHYELTFVRRQAVTRVIEAASEDEARRIGDELLASDFYLTLDEEMMEVFEPDTEVETCRRIDSYKRDDEFMSKEEVASYLGEE